MAKKLKPFYKIALLVIGLGALLYLSLLGARIIDYSAGGLIGVDGALNGAVQSDDVVAVRILLLAGADANALNPASGMTRLARAAEANSFRAAEILLDAGADPDRGGDIWRRPLFMAIANGHHDMADLLINRGATYTVVDALFRGDEEFVRGALEDNPRALENVRVYQMRPLQAAVEFRSLKAARILLDLGFEPTYAGLGESEVSALDVAKRRGYDDLVALFESHLAEQRGLDGSVGSLEVE